MKLTHSTETIPSFAPRTLSITFETEAEFNAFYGLFNTGAVSAGAAAVGVDSNAIRREMDKLNGERFPSDYDDGSGEYFHIKVNNAIKKFYRL